MVVKQQAVAAAKTSPIFYAVLFQLLLWLPILNPKGSASNCYMLFAAAIDATTPQHHQDVYPLLNFLAESLQLSRSDSSTDEWNEPTTLEVNDDDDVSSHEVNNTTADADGTATTTLPFLRRTIHQLLPSVNSAWTRSQEYGRDVVESVRQRVYDASITAQTDKSWRNTRDDDDSRNNSSDTSATAVAAALELLRENVTLAGNGWLDQVARSIVISASWITGIQAMVAWLSNSHAMDELTSRWLSAESSTAIATIRTILSNAEDHGLVDVIGKYPPSELASSIFVLSRLQQASAFYDETVLSRQRNLVDIHDNHLDIISDLAHYAKFASAAYGWKMDLVSSGRLHMGDDQALLKTTGISPDDVVSVQWQAQTHRPAYFIVKEMDRKRIVLSIRGTWSLRDILTDLCCTSEEFESSKGARHRAHHGMLEAARAVASTAQSIIVNELMKHPDFSLLIVGHSMGGGVAALLGMMWEDMFPEKIAVYVYGAPCVFPLHLSSADLSVPIVSVITQGDPMCTLSLGHVADLSFALSQLCERKDLRQTILSRTDVSVNDIDETDLRWCSETMQSLRQDMNGNRLYPPGQILLLSKIRSSQVSNRHSHKWQQKIKATGRATTESRIECRAVPPEYFQEVVISPRMFDLTKHAPARYQSWLKRVLRQEATITASNQQHCESDGGFVGQ